MYAIYEHPLDFPDHFVVRRWEVRGGEIIKHELMGPPAVTLQLARRQIPRGCVKLERHPEDDVALAETWI